MYKCPICKKRVARSESNFPFCSYKCKNVDLYKWFNEDYSIPAIESDDVEEADLEKLYDKEQEK